MNRYKILLFISISCVSCSPISNNYNQLKEITESLKISNAKITCMTELLHMDKKKLHQVLAPKCLETQAAAEICIQELLDKCVEKELNK